MQKNKNFTLIEIIVALTIFALLMPALTMTFTSGLKAFRKSQGYTNIIQDVRGVFLSLKNDAQFMVLVDKSSNIFEPKKISFVIQDPYYANQKRITYSFTDNQITRESRPISNKDERIIESVLLDKFEDIAIEYFVIDSWMPKTQNLVTPMGMRISVTGKKGDLDKHFSTVIRFNYRAELEDDDKK